MKKVIFTAAIVFLAIAVQAQDRSGRKSANKGKNESAVSQPSAAEAKHEKQAVQQETIMPDGTAAPATSGERQVAPGAAGISVKEAPRQAAQPQERASETVKPANVDDGSKVAPATRSVKQGEEKTAPAASEQSKKAAGSK